MGMSIEQFAVLVKSMKAVYTSQTFIPDKAAMNVWYALLKDLSYEKASEAIQKHMMTEKFPPTIADIRSKACDQVEEMNEMQAWALVRKAISNSNYHADEEFEKLPLECQKAVGNTAMLREWAMMDSEVVASVIKSHFARNYNTVVLRMREDAKLPVHLRSGISEREKVDRGRIGTSTQ